MKICGIGYAEQPNFQFLCDGVWDEPSWEAFPPITEEIYFSEKERFYTFNDTRVTCEKCLNKIKTLKLFK